MTDYAEEMKRVADLLSQKLVDPPNRRAAADVCAIMEKVYVSAIAGLFNSTVRTQTGLENAYEVVDGAADQLKDYLHEALYIIALGYDLKPRDITDHNRAVYHQIMKELKNAD